VRALVAVRMLVPECASGVRMLVPECAGEGAGSCEAAATH
jgi:hypothetical protein